MRKKRNFGHDSDELRPEYDLAALGPGVRGKYFERASSGTNIIRLDPKHGSPDHEPPDQSR
jgi:hypothetical protein